MAPTGAGVAALEGAKPARATAARRREQTHRAVARHMQWLLSLTQSERNHHTAPPTSPQPLVDRVALLESKLTEVMRYLAQQDATPDVSARPAGAKVDEA